jgi:hypothetical protein
VELEFALDADPRTPGGQRLCLLQMRSMVVPTEETRVAPVDLSGPNVLVAADRALGNGMRDDLVDVVYLRPEAFAAARTPAIALEVEAFNRRLHGEGRPYVLLGFGRWGSSDPWLGVPVDWGQISGARVIVEAAITGMNPDPSQGAHFFHNLIGLGVHYLTATGSGGNVDWGWLDVRPAAGESTHVRHLRLASPLAVRVDGLAGLAVIERTPS